MPYAPPSSSRVQVWQYVAGDRPALSRQEFYTAMKLVSLAQLNGGVLDDQQALRLVNGLAGPVPLPRMAGMTVPRGIELPANLLPPEPAAASAPGQAAASPAAPPARGGAPLASPPPPAAAFPPLAAEQAAAFQTAFSQLDTDRDGFVQVCLRLGCLPACCLALSWLGRRRRSQRPARRRRLAPPTTLGAPLAGRPAAAALLTRAAAAWCRARTASAPSCRAVSPRRR